MNPAVRTTLTLVFLAVFIYWLLDRWQESVIVNASGCESASGHELPATLCKAIIDYRFDKQD